MYIIWIYSILYNIPLTNTQTTKYEWLNDQLRDTVLWKLAATANLTVAEFE